MIFDIKQGYIGCRKEMDLNVRMTMDEAFSASKFHFL